MKVCLFSPPEFNNSNKSALYLRINLLKSISSVFVLSGLFDPSDYQGTYVSGNRLKKFYNGNNILINIFQRIFFEFNISWLLLKNAGRYDILIILLGSGGMLLPGLVCKLMGKKIVFIATGSVSQTAEKTYKKNIVNYILILIHKSLESTNYNLSNAIVVQTDTAIKNLALEKYRKKIKVYSARYIDTTSFNIVKPFNTRKYCVGYIGRLVPGKGVEHFVGALPLMANHKENFLIVGDGPLLYDISHALARDQIQDQVNVTGWIPNDRIHEYLNDLKIIVLSSDTEGLPGIVLEAMACGTIVLASPVGGIPDLIKDGETGFIINTNTPECIAFNIKRAMDHPQLEEIVKNSRQIIERDYTYSSSLKKFNEILEEI